MEQIKTTFKRCELKYVINENQKALFLENITPHIVPDKHKQYTICNLYCDTPDSRLIRTSIDKPQYKEKIRIRSYGVVDNQTNVFLELKKKYDGIVYKRRVTMPCIQAMQYLDQNSNTNCQIEKEINYFLQYYKYVKPMMYISYDREAYFGKDDSSLRVTFDKNILWRTTDLSLNSEVYGNSLLEPGVCILEIKCSDSMPLWLATTLSKYKIYKNSFSKYGNAYKREVEQLMEDKKIG